MLLSKARDFAQDFSRQPVKEAVITVPPYFNQAERRAVLNAAELAGIKVLQLINTNTAGMVVVRKTLKSKSLSYVKL
jgi:hypoxia up-regulated 1